jgi:MFS family permease
MIGQFYISNARWLGTGLAFTFMSSFGQTLFIALFAAEIQVAYGLSTGEWGAVYTAATLASAVALFRLGGLADTVRLDRLAIAIILIYAAVALGMALNHSVVGLILLVFGLRFCGQGMMSHLAVTTMGRWFRGHRGRAVAFAGLGFSIGEAALPAIAVALIAAIGWRETWGVISLLLLLGAAPLFAWLLARGRQPQGAGDADSMAGLHGRHWQRAEVVRHWTFWALMPAVLTPPFIGTALFFLPVHIAQVKGWELADMALGYPIYAGVTVSSVLLSGWLVDRLGPARLLPLYILPMAAGIALLGAVGDVSVWFVTLALAGLTQGMAQTVWGSLWPELYGTRHLGSVRSMATTAMVFSTAIGPGLAGQLIDAGIAFPQQGLAMALWCAGLSGVLLVVSRRIAGLRVAGTA